MQDKEGAWVGARVARDSILSYLELRLRASRKVAEMSIIGWSAVKYSLEFEPRKNPTGTIMLANKLSIRR